jgi:glycyl-tRNA synthetase beta chain
MAKTRAPARAQTVLVELLTEELPPKSVRALGEAFAAGVYESLRARDFLEPGSAYEPYATPRRLAVRVTEVRARQPDQRLERRGPSVQAGLDAEGRPTPALVGFARSCGVEPQRLERARDARGEHFVFRTVRPGEPLARHLEAAVAEALERLPIAKLMRWGSGEAEFVRPVHGLVMLHGSRLVPGRALGARSSRRTLGHRFLARAPVALAHADDYERRLREAGVVASFEARRREVVEGLRRAAGSGAVAVADDALYDEITGLTEAPTAYEGRFDPEFLALPEECLIVSMQQHQKYVPLREERTGKLLPRFLFVANIAAKDASEIVRGNERVLRARLADAKFFYEHDLKTRLEARVPRLAAVVYHGRLGSQLERVERIQLLAGAIARKLGVEPLLAERAAWLAKADLLTEMVGEFPELQGIMGRYYALADGEPPEVAEAIEEHYRPRFAGDRLPESGVGIAVALADRLDALAGLFGIGQTPTGDKDPYGLRRAALGVVRILVERDLALSLPELIESAFRGYGDRVEAAHEALAAFVYDRLAGYLREAGYSALEIESVLSLRPAQIRLVPRQLEAVRAFRSLPEAESLAAANKRVANILKQAQARGEAFSEARADRLRESAERELFLALEATTAKAMRLYEQGDFTGYLRSFAALKKPVDAFFESVLVMAEDPELRRNRLALLAALRHEMNRVADLSKLAA